MYPKQNDVLLQLYQSHSVQLALIAITQKNIQAQWIYLTLSRLSESGNKWKVIDDRKKARALYGAVN